MSRQRPRSSLLIVQLPSCRSWQGCINSIDAMNSASSLLVSKLRLHPLGLKFVALALLVTGAFAAAPDSARVTTSLQPDAGRLIVDVHGVPPPAPVFYSVAAEQSV